MVIDKLADALNTLSPGIDTPKPVKKERTVSWSERAFSFWLPKTNTNEKEMEAKHFEYEPSDSAYDHVQSHTSTGDQVNLKTEGEKHYAAKPKARMHEEYWGSEQRDVEVQGSDEMYDNNQASFTTDEDHYKGHIMHHRHDSSVHPAAALPKVLYNPQFSPMPCDSSEEDEPAYQQCVRGSMSGSVPPPPREVLKEKSASKTRDSLGTSVPHMRESYASVVRRDKKDGQDPFFAMEPWSSRRRSVEAREKRIGKATRSMSQDSWFNTDPESGRVAVPPLSVPLSSQPTEPAKIQDTLSLETSPKTGSKTIAGWKDTSEKPTVDVVDRKRHQTPAEKDLPFDSDFENWAPRPATTHYRRHSTQWPHNYELVQPKEPSMQTHGKTIWEVQADATNYGNFSR
ncbi:hypothetical protein DFQ30_005411 [Apophysomyces sp. BC1015]|nr:hypothetical protein DFQ30_005411 [Apophysomyces sp. BC1015]